MLQFRGMLPSWRGRSSTRPSWSLSMAWICRRQPSCWGIGIALHALLGTTRHRPWPAPWACMSLLRCTRCRGGKCDYVKISWSKFLFILPIQYIHQNIWSVFGIKIEGDNFEALLFKSLRGRTRSLKKVQETRSGMGLGDWWLSGSTLAVSPDVGFDADLDWSLYFSLFFLLFLLLSCSFLVVEVVAVDRSWEARRLSKSVWNHCQF
jgi:hypothetical protein